MTIQVEPQIRVMTRKGMMTRGFDFYDWGPGEARLVTSWDSDSAHVEALAEAISAL